MDEGEKVTGDLAIGVHAGETGSLLNGLSSHRASPARYPSLYVISILISGKVKFLPTKTFT